MNIEDVTYVHWLNNSSGTIGIVCAKDPITGEDKAYMKSVDGFNEEADIKNILSWGSKIHYSVACVLFDKLKPKLDNNNENNQENFN